LQQQRTRALVESALLAAIGVVLVLVGYYVPILGTIAMFLWPLPSAVCVIRHGTRWGFLSSLVTGLALLLFMDWFTVLGLWILFAATGITFGYTIKEGYSSMTIILLTSVAFLVGIVASFLSMYLIGGFSVSDLLDAYVSSLGSASSAVEKILGRDSLGQFGDLENLKNQMLRLLPGGVLAGAVIQSYLSFEVGRRVLDRIGCHVEPLPPFSEWILPDYIGFIAIASFIALILGQQYNNDVVLLIGENVFSVMCLVMFIQGASLVSYYLLRAGFPGFLVGLAVVFLFLTSGINTLIMVVGLSDVLFDFRRLRYGWVDEL